ncbi:phosphatase PAP2 family protein [Streptomyces sp. DT171]|uniref:phosphatase PAP2 family protein n=1 Tax=Streptomyces sp. DT171 TaxID=3416524 RepID=UPI003CF660CD
MFVALLGLFALVSAEIATDGPLRAADERAGRAVVGHGPGRLTEFLADLGDVQVALPVLVGAIGYALWRGARRAPVYAALAMAAVPAVLVPLKAAFARSGPLTEATGYYPSGHTATAAVAYCGAALLIRAVLRTPPDPAPRTPPRALPHVGAPRAVPVRWAVPFRAVLVRAVPVRAVLVRAVRKAPMPVAVMVTVATGIGLVLRGYHWPLDVLGSWCLSGLLLFPLGCRARREGRAQLPK